MPYSIFYVMSVPEMLFLAINFTILFFSIQMAEHSVD